MSIDEAKKRTAAVWGLGEYSDLSEMLRPAAQALCDACAVGAGQEVLDVAAGDGNFALACAFEGASVVASDLSPGMVERGRARSDGRGLRRRVDRGRRRGPPVRRRPLRMRRLGVRRDDRASATGRGRGAVPRRPARQHRRHDRLDAGEQGDRDVPRSAAATRPPRRRAPRHRGVGCRGHRPRALRRAGQHDRVRAARRCRGEPTRRRRSSQEWSASAPPQAAAKAACRPRPTRSCAREHARPRCASWAGGDGPFEVDVEYLLIVARRRG